MSELLLIAAACFITFSIFNIWRRPGFFAAVYLLSYGLAIFFGSIGPIVGAISIITALAVTSQDRTFHGMLKPEYALLLWIGYQSLSLFSSPQMDITEYYVASVVLLAGGSYLYARTFASYENFFEDMLLGAAIIAVLVTGRMFLATHGIGLLGEAEGLSHVGVAGLPELCLTGVLSFLLFHRDHSWKVALGALLFIFAVLGPLTLGLGTRSVMLSVGVTFVILLAYRVRQGNAQRILIGIGASIVTLASVMAIFWYQVVNTAIGKILIAGGGRLISGALVGNIAGDESSLIRLELYREAWRLFYQAPIFGSGAGSFGYLADNAGGAYPHNMFLEILVQSGLFGLLLFLAFCIPLGFRGLRDMLQRPIPWTVAFALAMFISTFIRHQVSLSVTQGKLLFFALGCFAARQIIEQRSTYITHSADRQYPPKFPTR